MRPLRVLQVFEPGCDGVFRHVEQLVEFLWAAGVECDLAFSSQRPSAGLFAMVDRVRARGGVAVDLKVGPAPRIGDLRAGYALDSLFAGQRHRIVHAHSSKAGGLVRGMYPCFGEAHIFYTPHAYYGMGGRSSAKIRFFNLIEAMLGQAGTTINVSGDEAAFARRHLGADASLELVIPNPVDCLRFQPPSATQRDSARAQLGVPRDRFVVGYASRYTEQKDPLLAYESFARFAATHPDVHLLHLCKESLLGDARRFVRQHNLEDRVTFVDYMEDVRSFYHALDLFLLTSRYEAGWPFVILEALACNLPVVTSACPGLSDVGRAGLSHCEVFKVGDQPGCLAALEAAYGKRGQVPLNHRLTAESRFSIQHCFGGVLHQYERACAALASRRIM